jgi:hypothetical protein
VAGAARQQRLQRAEEAGARALGGDLGSGAFEDVGLAARDEDDLGHGAPAFNKPWATTGAQRFRGVARPPVQLLLVSHRGVMNFCACPCARATGD